MRYCPALAKKPVSKPNDHERRGPKPDPFQDPSPALLIAEIPNQGKSTHFLVLNKFPVIPNHFILATKAFKPQTDLLEKEDLAVSFACLQEWAVSAERRGDDSEAAPRRRLFAFFNSGEESGASQPHRHLQFLPVEDMRGPEEPDSTSWIPIIDRLASSEAVTTASGFLRLPGLPFVHLGMSLPREPSANALHEIYLSLYRAAGNAIQAGHVANSVQEQTRGPSAISYNLAMTESIMMICPRRSEHARLPIADNKLPDVADAASVSLNGTILAGTLMVKVEAEWKELCENSESLNSLLVTVGFPANDRESSHGS